MGKLFSHLLVQFRQFYKNLTPVKRLSVIGASIAGIVGMAVVALMLTGTNHVPLFTNIAPDQLPQIVDQLQKRGVPSKLVYFPDENHWVLKPQNSLFWYQTVRDWVATYAPPGGR